MAREHGPFRFTDHVNGPCLSRLVTLAMTSPPSLTTGSRIDISFARNVTLKLIKLRFVFVKTRLASFVCVIKLVVVQYALSFTLGQELNSSI
jgi:hypothetical protein